MTTREPFNVVIAGGGVAGLEAALALRELAGDRVSIQLLARNAEFVYRPMTVAEPFAYPPAKRYPIDEIAGEAGAELIADELSWVDAPGRIVHTKDGCELAYDALLIATGARVRSRFPNALAIDDRRMDELLHGIVQDVEGGYVRSLAFVAPPRMAWPLPIYELALMTAHRAYDMSMSVEITVVTPELAPLAIFGELVSQGVAKILREAGITTIGSAHVEVPRAGHVVIQPGDRSLEVDRVIALPELFGPSVRGVLCGPHGFLPVDAHAQVRGLPRVFAAGDASDCPLKHGSMSAHQADMAARSIAALAGAPVSSQPVHARIHGMLLTGGKPKYLTAQISGSLALNSQITDEPVFGPTAKIAAARLGPYLERCDRAAPVG